MGGNEQRLKLSDIAAALGVPLTRLKTMRARGQSGTWDAWTEDIPADVAGPGWRFYSMTDAVALACVLDLVERGVNSDVAGSIIWNVRQHIYDGPHPRVGSPADIFVGALYLSEGRAHVGGPLGDVLKDIDRHVRADIRAFENGGGTGLFLVNASRHYRRLLEKLPDAE